MAITSVPSTTSTTDAPGSTNKSAMAMLTTLFFMWGFLTTLNDILIPHLRNIFSLDYAQSMLVQFTFFSAYFIFGVPSGWVVEWIGYKRTMVLGLFTMGLGALLFIPAASAPSFALFLAAQAVLALGIVLLQVAANPYVSVLGPAPTAPSRLNLAQAFNSLGTTVAPFFGSLLILSATAKSTLQVSDLKGAALHYYRVHEAATVKMPYLGIAVILIILGVAIAIFKFPRLDVNKEHHPKQPGEHHVSVWRYRHLILGAVAIFVYCGAEVAIGSFLTNYFSQPDTGGLTIQTAAKLVTFYWGGAMIGRFIGSAVLQRVAAGKLVGLCALVALGLVVTSMLSFGYVAVWTMLAVGLFNSIMFPTIFTLGIAELGPLTGEGSGILISAIVGAALIPLAEGALADRIGIHHAFIFPALCYVYIAYYGFSGSKVRHPVAA